MPRTRIQFPKGPQFATGFTVRASDFGSSGAFDEISVIYYLREGFERMLDLWGIVGENLEKKRVFCGDIALVLLSELERGQAIRAEFSFGEVGRVEIPIYMRLFRIDTNRIVAETRAAFIFIGTERKKPAKVPKALVEHLLSLDVLDDSWEELAENAKFEQGTEIEA